MTTSDTRPGGLLRRREAIAALGTLGVGAGIALWRATQGNGQEIAGDTSASREARAADQCVLIPEQTEGPYYISGEPFRRTNATDSIYASGGPESTLKLPRARNRKGKKKKRGYEGRIALGVT
jgi:hypothetical protein